MERERIRLHQRRGVKDSTNYLVEILQPKETQTELGWHFDQADR